MFSAYPSITNHYQARFIRILESLIDSGRVPADEPFYFTEKVHGANLQIYIGEDGIRPARRNALLNDGESFNGAWELVDELRPKLLELRTAVLREHPTAKVVIVCGELCGGEYPGVKPIKPVSRVQTGVFYSPDHVFYAFDIAIQSENGDVTFLDWNQASAMLSAVELFRATTDGVMTAKDLVTELVQHNTIRHIPSTFESTIPARLGLPSLPSNVAEGYVIRPNKTYFDRDGGSRIIFKYKSSKFAEKTGNPAPPTKAFDSELEQAWAIIKGEFLGEEQLRNRLACITSKGELRLDEPKQRGALLTALATDVMVEAKSSHTITPAIQKRVFAECGKFLQSEATREH